LLVAQSVYAKIVGRGNNELERMRKVLYWRLRGCFKENDEKEGLLTTQPRLSNESVTSIFGIY
jgi:hypothetical protein